MVSIFNFLKNTPRFWIFSKENRQNEQYKISREGWSRDVFKVEMWGSWEEVYSKSYCGIIFIFVLTNKGVWGVRF